MCQVHLNDHLLGYLYPGDACFIILTINHNDNEIGY